MTPTPDLRGLSSPDAGMRATVSPPRSRWKTRVLLPGAILLTIVILLLVTSARILLPSTPVRVIPVVVKTVEGATGTVTVQAPGWLEPDPHPYYVTALADGVVREMLVLEGDRVEPDQIVARLVDDDARLALQRVKAQLLQRRSERLGAQAELTAARQELASLVEPSRAVATGEAAVAESRAEIERVQADLAVAQARRLELEDELDRKSSLIESQAVSAATVARLRLRVEAERASVDVVVARRSVLEAKQVRAEAELRAARDNHRLLIKERRAVSLAEAAVSAASAAVALAETARDEAALELARMSIRSPHGGVVMRRLVAPGSKVTREGPEYSAHVVHVYDPASLQVRVDVPLADAAHVAVGQRAEITVEVLPDHTFTGVVTRLVHEADIQKNTVEVKVAVDDPSPELKPDMLARIRFIASAAVSDGSVRQRVFAPGALVADADADGERGALVVTNLIDGRGRVERRAIVLGPKRIDGWIEIERGLQIGDLLVADPSPDLQAGDRVRVIGEAKAGGGS